MEMNESLPMREMFLSTAVALIVCSTAPAVAGVSVDDTPPSQGATGNVMVTIQPSAAADKTANVLWSEREIKRAFVSQIGVPEDPVSPVKGFGRDVPILHAVRQVVPAGWRGFSVGEVNVQRKIDWKGEGKSWVAVLSNIAESGGVLIQVDWNRKEINISADPSAKNVSEESGAQKIASERGATGQQWNLVSGKTLRENMENWAKMAGWSLVWQPGFEFPVTIAATLIGPFDDKENGPIAVVVQSYQDSDFAIEAEFIEGNRVLEITRSKYSRERIGGKK